MFITAAGFKKLITDAFKQGGSAWEMMEQELS